MAKIKPLPQQLQSSPEEIQELSDAYSKGLGLQDQQTPSEQIQEKSNLRALEAETEEAQRNASFADKARAFGYIYDRGTLVGSILETVGITNYQTNASDFKRQDGYKVDVDTVMPFLIQYNTNEDETTTILNSCSPEHLQANLESVKRNRNLDTFVSRTLTEGENKFANLYTVLDIDLLAPTGATVAGGRGLFALTKAGKQSLAVGVSALSASKPLVVNSIFDKGVSGSELVEQMALYGSLEYLAMMKFTPEVKIKASEDIASSIASKKLTNGSGIIPASKQDITLQVQKWSKEPFDVVDEASVIEIPRATPELRQLVDKELVNIVGEQMNKSGVKSTIAGYAHASNDIDDMFTKIQRHIIENPQDAKSVGKAIQSIREEIDAFVKGLDDVNGLTKAEKESIAMTAKKSVDAFENGTVLKADKTSLDAVKDIMAKIRSGADDLFKQHANMTKINKIEAKIASLEKEIKSLGTKDEIRKGILKNEVAKQQKSLGKVKEAEIGNIEQRLYDNLNGGVRLKREGNNYKFGNKLIPVAVVLGALSTGAFAKSENEQTAGDVFLTTVQSLIILGVLGGVGYNAYKSYGKSVATRLSQTPAQIGAIQEEATRTSKVLTSLRGNYETVRTSFTETFGPLIQQVRAEGNVDAIKFIENVLVNPLEGKSQVGEWTKQRLFDKFIREYKAVEDKLFKEWYKTQDSQGLLSHFESFHGINREKFRTYVTSMKDGIGEVPEQGKEFVEKMAKESSRMLNEQGILKAKELGLDGAEVTKMLEEYVRRSWKSGIQNTFRLMTPESLVAVKNSFKDMYLSAIHAPIKALTSANGKVEKMFDKFASMDDFKKMIDDHEETFKAITSFDEDALRLLDEAKGATDLVEARSLYAKFATHINEMASEEKATLKVNKYFEHIMSDGFRGGVADVASQFKNRIPFDFKSYKPIEIEMIDGRKGFLTMDAMFERNDFALSSAYMNSLSGRIALQASGFSVESAKDAIKTIKDARSKELAEKVLNSMIGVPLIKADEKLLQVLQVVGNASVGMSLPFVVFSFLQEAGMLGGKLMFNAKERQMVLGEIVSIIRGHGDDSAMVQFVKERVGLGINYDISNIGSRFDVDMRDAGIFGLESNTAVNISKIARDSVFKYSGMLKFSDILEVSNAIANMQRLAEMANNLKVVNPALAKKYGLSVEDLELAKKALKFNDKGHVKVPEWDNLSHIEQDRLSNILWNMGQVGAQRSSLGGTATWTRDNVLGHAVSKLLMYPMNSFANIGLHQLRSVAHGDVETSVSAFFGYVGSYVGSKVRDGVLGREKTEEEYHMYALTSIPLFAPYSLAKGLSQPAFFKFPKQAFSDMSLVLNGAVGSD
ncbi:MAG: hypothetical protein EOM05_08605 [Clostridia bacterium]|nr:hypothetical protein [Clostridia bacterium]